MNMNKSNPFKICDNTEQIKIKYLQEEQFQEQMAHTAEPYLKKYRRCGRFASFDGTQVFYCMYVRAHAKGSIVISHGFSEFEEKYHEVIYYFLQAGYSVFFLEHRGHGRSQRTLSNMEKVYVESFAQYVRDLRIFIKKIVKPFQNEMILFAHSMGGAIGALYLERYSHDFKKAVLSAPMIQMNVSGLPYPAAMAIARICARCGFGKAYAAGQHGFSKKPNFERSSCLSMERYLYAHRMRLWKKRCRTSGATYAWVRAAANAAVSLQAEQNIKKIRIPVLLCAAGRDHMVDTDAICKFAGKLKNARLVWFSDAKHEIFNGKEPARLQFFEEIFSFLQETIIQS
ncbi:MAG: alpha/beta hydrolase [Eubacterium sp.]|nr:alpha/beta hydrolase [Eubacterium sp.]